MNVKQISNCYHKKDYKNRLLSFYKNSISKSFSLLALTSLLNANVFAAEKLLYKNNSISSFNASRDKISNKKLRENLSKIINNNELISSTIVNPNLLTIDGPLVTLIFKEANAKEIFEYLAEIGGYGFVWVRNNPNKETDVDNKRLISMKLNNVAYEEAFNSLLLSSGLQAKLFNNVLYVGPNVRNTIFTTRATDVYQLNQISASSAADYLANLGASVTKTFTIKTSVTSGASQSQAVQGGSTSATTTDQSEISVKVYGATIGPLVGLIATTDERLRTVTMVGEKDIIELATSFLNKLDIKQKQVALSVKVLDVNLSDKDSFLKDYGLAFRDALIIGNQGNIKSSFGAYLPTFPSAGGAATSSPNSSFINRPFFGLLEASIENGTTKVLASPTLLLSESAGTAGDGNSIGRKISNEGFVEIGDQVPVDAKKNDGGTCDYTFENVGVKLGAKILGIDQENFVTFTMTPIVTGISGSFNIVGCGQVSKINNRRLDTGAIRIKDGETLVLTGVIQETDINTTYKYPILGDIPLLGSLFRSKQKTKDKRELIVLVTPKVLDQNFPNVEDYNLEYTNEGAKNLINKLKN